MANTSEATPVAATTSVFWLAAIILWKLFQIYWTILSPVWNKVPLQQAQFLVSSKHTSLLVNELIVICSVGSDIKADFLSNATGVDWISFTWAPSRPTCQEFVSSYNVTVTTSNIVQQVLVNSECFTIQTGGEIIFNSSNSCSEQITISPCSVYTVEVIPEFYSNYLGASNSFNTVSDPGMLKHSPVRFHLNNSVFCLFRAGNYARIENLSSPSNATDSIKLTFDEPKCKVSAGLMLYIVIITTLRDQSYPPLFVEASCVENGSLTLGSSATCQSATTTLASCSFYNISIYPIYDSISNVLANGASVPAYTERVPGDASVTNLLSNPLLSSSIQLQWRRPKCAHEINEWRLLVSDHGTKQAFSIPYQCPNISGDIFTLSISENIKCANQQSLPGYSVLPCFDYQVQLEANFVSIDSDGPKLLNHTTASERMSPAQYCAWSF